MRRDVLGTSNLLYWEVPSEADFPYYTQDPDGTWWYWRQPGSRTRHEERECERCGGCYKTQPTKTSHFCGRECADSSKRRGSTRPCVQCDREFYVSRSSDRKGSGPVRYCSKQCEGLSRRVPLGHRRLDAKRGYVWVAVPPDTPGADAKGNHKHGSRWLMEHRLVMGEAVGRPLEPSETVHHINGDRQDNRRENLQLRRHQHGAGQSMQCGDCGGANIQYVALGGV